MDEKLLFMGCFWHLINGNIKMCVNEFKDIERIDYWSDSYDFFLILYLAV